MLQVPIEAVYKVCIGFPSRYNFIAEMTGTLLQSIALEGS